MHAACCSDLGHLAETAAPCLGGRFAVSRYLALFAPCVVLVKLLLIHPVGQSTPGLSARYRLHCFFFIANANDKLDTMSVTVKANVNAKIDSFSLDCIKHAALECWVKRLRINTGVD